jgi:hypothetical protein
VKVSEKSLELNVGTELLNLMRNSWGMPKTYLRGLTQREEKQEGVDFFAQLDPATRLFAFQFKAPKGRIEGVPYRYTLMRDQHNVLFPLAQSAPNSVFYVLPFYVAAAKLQQDVPVLMQDTWLLPVEQMPSQQLFGTAQSKVLRCQPGLAIVNPEYRIHPVREVASQEMRGVPVRQFAEWYLHFRDLRGVADRLRSPWLARGLRVAVALP